MTEKRFTYDKPLVAFSKGGINDNVTGETYEFTMDTVLDLLNEQQATIEKQKRIIKSQDMEISRQYNLCLAMSGVLREEFGVYDVFDRTKDRKID